jgi:hypothetical protein
MGEGLVFEAHANQPIRYIMRESASFFRVLFAGLPSEWNIRFISGTEKASRLSARNSYATNRRKRGCAGDSARANFQFVLFSIEFDFSGRESMFDQTI